MKKAIMIIASLVLLGVALAKLNIFMAMISIILFDAAVSKKESPAGTEDSR